MPRNRLSTAWACLTRATMVLPALALLLTLAGNALSQTASYRQIRQLSVDELIRELDVPPYSLSVIHRLRETNDIKALPALRRAFERAPTRLEKQAIAAAAVSLKDKEGPYWPFLLRYAMPAVNSKIPFPLSFDEKGNIKKGIVSPEFEAWCKETNNDPKTAATQALYTLPLDVSFLAMAADERGLEYFFIGLNNPNHMIAARSAEGLMRLSNKRSIRVIADRCENTPAEAAEVIATPLVFLQTPEADNVATRFIRSKSFLESLRQRAKRLGPAGIFAALE